MNAGSSYRQANSSLTLLAYSTEYSNKVGDEFAGLGSILDTVSEDTEDTASLCNFILYLRHIQAFFLSEKVSEDTEDTVLS